MATQQTDGAWATLLTREDYLPGVRVLWRSLQDVGTAYPLIVMVTDGVPADARAQLAADGCQVLEVDRVDPPDATGGEHSYVFEHFSEVWTKLRAWCLDHERVVLLDADMLVVGAMDALMTMPLPDGGIAACHTCRCNPEHNDSYPADWVPERCWFTYWSGTRELPADFDLYFNSGVVVLRPDAGVFDALVDRIAGLDLERYPFPDQDLLNEHFRDRWAALPMGYNALKTLALQHPDVWSGEPDAAGLQNIHYLLAKPWSKDGPPTEPVYAALDRFWHEAEARLAE
jgi:alpha-N-acetylglucosamine transferase